MGNHGKILSSRSVWTDVNFRSLAEGGRWGTGVDQMQGYRKGALDMCPGRTRCGLEPGRDKETGVGQRGINKGNRQESVAA